ncbi:MAG TPA: lysylphosphatidylglycerol synthase domain-containing protein [Gaiellaceae bacterium]|nr:lysylphosphatidylglycerol synthase domain-containing protein [Gaiellaceae bacterium]
MNLFGEVGGALEDAAGRVGALDGRYLAAALLLQLATLAMRALAWRGALAAAYPDRRLPLVSLGCAYAAGVALNAYLPARGGEGAKVLLARAQIPGSSVPTVAGSLSVVLTLDAVLGAGLVSALWATGVLPALPAPSATGVAVACTAAAAVVGAVLVLRSRSAAVRRLLAAWVQGLAILARPRLYAATVLPYQLAAWACRIAVVFLVLHAFRIEAGLATAALLVVLNGASTAVPVPGGAGSQQVLATFALQGIVSTAAAVSFSLGLQVGVTVVNTAVGIAATMLLFRTLRPLQAARAVAAARS